MKRQLLDAWETIVPPKGAPHGKLPPLLLLLTVVTGLVDAFSYLTMGHVFVANMTGNVVFLAFALGGAAGFIWWASLLAIGTFLLGAFLGGRLAARTGLKAVPGRQLQLAAGLQFVLVAVGLVVALTAPISHGSYHGWPLALLILFLGSSMGLQNATARALAVPDLTTTVLTLTITGLSADSRAAGGQGSRIGRRLLSIVTMFGGALIGVLLIRADLGWVVLTVALILLVVVALGARRATATGSEQQRSAA